MAVDNQVTINYAVMVPYGLISKIEDSEDVAYIYCKDMRTLKVTISFVHLTKRGSTH